MVGIVTWIPLRNRLPFPDQGSGDFYGLRRGDLNKLVQYGGFDYRPGLLVFEFPGISQQLAQHGALIGFVVGEYHSGLFFISSLGLERVGHATKP